MAFLRTPLTNQRRWLAAFAGWLILWGLGVLGPRVSSTSADPDGSRGEQGHSAGLSGQSRQTAVDVAGGVDVHRVLGSTTAEAEVDLPGIKILGDGRTQLASPEWRRSRGDDRPYRPLANATGERDDRSSEDEQNESDDPDDQELDDDVLQDVFGWHGSAFDLALLRAEFPHRCERPWMSRMDEGRVHRPPRA